MLKIIGGLIVITASFLFGYNIKRKMKSDCEFLSDMADGFCAVKEDIRYNSDYLLNSVKKTISVSGMSSVFFRKICDEMECGKSAEEALKNATFLVPSEDVKGLLFDTADKIGKTDSDGQISLLNLLVERLNTLYKKQSEFYEKQGGIYPKFGIAFGVLITILII